MASIRRAWLILAIGGIASWLTSTVLTGDDTLLGIAAVAAPCVLIAGALWALGLLVRSNPLALFTPVGPLAVMTIVFFGVGALVPSLANFATLEYLHSSYDFTLAEQVAVHRLSGLGLCLVALIAYGILRRQPQRELVIGQQINVPAFRRSITVFLAVGLIVTLTVSIPHQLGIIRIAPPTYLVQLGQTATIGIFLIGFGMSRGLISRKVYLPIYATVTAVLLGGAVLSFSKTSIMTQGAAAFGGFLLAKPSRTKLVVAAASAIAVFLVISPLIGTARAFRELGATSVEGRIDAARSTIGLAREVLDQDELPNPVLSRLTYVNTMAWAINEHDEGRPGTSMAKDAVWMLVPRTLWPDKPYLSNVGREVTALMIDPGFEDNTYTGLTVFGEGYWNAGYLGVVIACIAVGVLVGVFTVLSFDALVRMDAAGFVFVWGGAMFGLRIDGWFGSDYVGQVIVLLGLYGVVSLMLGLARERPSLQAPARA